MTRAGIRTKMAELLAALEAFAYTTPAGVSAPNVFKARLDAVPPERWPAACVYFEGEEIEPEHKKGSARTLHRAATFVVDVMAANADPEDLEAALDTLAGSVEAALTVDNTLAGTARGIDVKSVEYDRNLNPEAEIYIGVAVLTFMVWYESTEGA